MRRNAEGLLERPREVGLGDLAHLRQAVNGPVLVRGGIHAVFRAQEAAQQCGGLGGVAGVDFGACHLLLRA